MNNTSTNDQSNITTPPAAPPEPKKTRRRLTDDERAARDQAEIDSREARAKQDLDKVKKARIDKADMLLAVSTRALKDLIVAARKAELQALAEHALQALEKLEVATSSVESDPDFEVKL